MTHAEKYADWRERRPAESERLEKAICRRLGMRRGITSELARETVEQWAAAMCAAMLGWPDEPDPMPTDPPPLHAAKKALDLEEVETPLTGRDRAAGTRDD